MNYKKNKTLERKKLLFSAWSSKNEKYYAFQAWYKPLSNIFSKIIVFDPQQELYNYGKEEMNKRFLDLVKKEQPDYIFLWLIYDEFSIETFKKIREISPKSKLVNFSWDDDVYFKSYSIFYSSFIDYILVGEVDYLENYEKEGIKNAVGFLGVDDSKYNFKRMDEIYDVTFIGGPKSDRYDYIRYLKNNGIKIKLFGGGWEDYSDLKDVYCGSLNSEDFIKVLNQSKITLCFTKNYFDEPHFNSRFFEFSASKVFNLVQYFEGFLKFFKEDKEIVMFDSKEELLRKIKFYLKNEDKRKEVINKAYLKIKKNFSAELKFRDFFKSIEGKASPRKDIPEIKDVIYYLSKEESNLNLDKLKEKTKKADYVCFESGKEFESRKRIQAYSIEHFKKPISCCDYYIYDRKLNDFMLFTSKFAFNLLNKENFNSLIIPAQIMVKKDFFLRNLDAFKGFLKGKRDNYDLFTEKNVCFVSIPLVRVRKIKEIKYDEMKKVFLLNFVNELRRCKYEGKVHFIRYIKDLIMKSFSQPFIMKYLLEIGYSKTLSRLKSRFSRIF